MVNVMEKSSSFFFLCLSAIFMCLYFLDDLYELGRSEEHFRPMRLRQKYSKRSSQAQAFPFS